MTFIIKKINAGKSSILDRSAGTSWESGAPVVEPGVAGGLALSLAAFSSFAQATIRSVPGGSVLATGFAEEIRGQGNVNTTSALENAETSAIGRVICRRAAKDKYNILVDGIGDTSLLPDGGTDDSAVSSDTGVPDSGFAPADEEQSGGCGCVLVGGDGLGP